MNKTELVAAMSEQAGISKKDALAALEAFTDVSLYTIFTHHAKTAYEKTLLTANPVKH